MQVIFEMTQGDVPDTPVGSQEYFLVRAYSHHSEAVHTFAAYFLNEYPLSYEWGCNDCEERGEENCPMSNGDGCPTTGWFVDALNGDDEVYERVSTQVQGFARMPKPQPQLSLGAS